MLIRTKTTIVRLIATSCLLVAVVAGFAVASHEQDENQHCRPVPTGIPRALSVPDDECLGEHLQGSGVQIYTCAAGAWSLLAPEANLTDPVSRAYRGNHFLGPAWQDRDGSKIHGVKAASAAAPNAVADIPWLLLNVTDESGPGRFSNVKHVQRIETVGGVAPAGSCASGSQIGVSYSATYLFYRVRLSQ